ncbi:MAG: 4Fe-4S cluster-binding domain-containing protein [Magnetovibrio sp.]|nr:4Fe-4S cluster-binding domain-containing protein [Magnetovibrio sp.]
MPGVDAIFLRPSHFNVFVDSFFEACTIAFNTRTGAFRALDEKAYADFLNLIEQAQTDKLPNTPGASSFIDELYQDGFFVADDLNERRLFQDKYKESQAKGRGLALTIAPTVNCNFGCTYCFQDHQNRQMSDQDQWAVVRHVEENLEENSSLSITWFGGEPLLAFSKVESLAQTLLEIAEARQCSFHQTMITNGYLLNKKRAQALANFKNLAYIQITLDGPAEHHDQRRVTVGKGKPTFKKILDNVCDAASQIPITLRVNIDKSNVDGLETLVDEIVGRGLVDKVHLYLGHTLPYTETCADVEQTALSREQFAVIEARFKLYMIQRGFRNVVALPRPNLGNLCIADLPNGRVISPGGAVFKCWNETTLPKAEATAFLGSDGVAKSSNNDRDKQWQSFDPFAHTPCQSCNVQPLCKGGCPWEALKNTTSEPGHCTPLRWSLPDILRLYHLETTVQTSLKARCNDRTAYPCP